MLLRSCKTFEPSVVASCATAFTVPVSASSVWEKKRVKQQRNRGGHNPNQLFSLGGRLETAR
jgi:hypothetical protein